MTFYIFFKQIKIFYHLKILEMNKIIFTNDIFNKTKDPMYQAQSISHEIYFFFSREKIVKEEDDFLYFL